MDAMAPKTDTQIPTDSKFITPPSGDGDHRLRDGRVPMRRGREDMKFWTLTCLITLRIPPFLNWCSSFYHPRPAPSTPYALYHERYGDSRAETTGASLTRILHRRDDDGDGYGGAALL